MREAIANLESPYPLGAALPALYQEDGLAQRFTAALDEILAPVFCTLDNLDAYFDPRLAPDDFVAWLAGWVGLAVDDNWPLERQRALIAEAANLYRWQGTARGLAAHVALYTGTTPEIVDSGGSSWSTASGGDLPGMREPRITVRIRVDKESDLDTNRIDAIVAAAKPAHVPHEIEVLQR